jgi:hypothetical protein
MSSMELELLAEVHRIREALCEQLLLQYGTEPKDIEAVIDKLITMRADRLALDKELS